MAADISRVLKTYEGVISVNNDLQKGKREAHIELRESGRALGLTTSSLGLQIRHALAGFEAQKMQGEDEEIKVRVLLPQESRHDMEDLLKMRILTPSGARVPLEEVGKITFSRGYASLSRLDGKRAASVTAEVDEGVANVSQIVAQLSSYFTNIEQTHPGITITLEGREKEARDSMASLSVGFPVALVLIYGIIAVLFKSYTQPLIIMIAIPYSIGGSILGHILMGYPLTMLSMIGMVALAGIVVNDSLILVDFINRLRCKGNSVYEAVIMGSKARLRAILLTTITTALGLTPLMFEESFQAQFLIPLAISIVFGLCLATVLTLVLVPALYLVLEDFKALGRKLWKTGDL